VITFAESPNTHFRLSRGEPSWIRTSDLLIKSQLLYQLSYGPTSAARLAAAGVAGKRRQLGLSTADP
jgi:hypothetical protein